MTLQMRGSNPFIYMILVACDASRSYENIQRQKIIYIGK